MFHHTYWLPGMARKRSTTGEEICQEIGPFCVALEGCAHRELTVSEFNEYVLRIHGRLPSRIQTEVVH